VLLLADVATKLTALERVGQRLVARQRAQNLDFRIFVRDRSKGGDFGYCWTGLSHRVIINLHPLSKWNSKMRLLVAVHAEGVRRTEALTAL
jgi:hypothetical protein